MYDTTVEALARTLEHSPRGLLLVRDELSGWISGFDQYKRAQGADAAHFLSMHRAGELLIDRKTNGEVIHVPRAAVSITGGIQPRVLRRVLGQEYLDNGLAARLLLAMPPRLPKRWTEEVVATPTATSYSGLYEGLLELGFKTDADNREEPIDLRLTRSGKDAWVHFYNCHGLEQAQRAGNVAAAFSKLEGYCARLALVIHLVRWQAGDRSLEVADEVDSSSISAAAVLTSWFACETQRVYTALGITSASDGIDLEGIIHRHGGRISVRELMHTCRAFRGSAAEAEAALQTLVDCGRGEWDRVRPKGGRPTREFVLLDKEHGDGGNGNETHPIECGRHGVTSRPESGCGDIRVESAHSRVGNTTPGSVTTQEVLTP